MSYRYAWLSVMDAIAINEKGGHVMNGLKSIRNLLLYSFTALTLASCDGAYLVDADVDYIWVPEYRTYDGAIIYRHRNYIGPRRRDREWLPGHYDNRGRWQEARWNRIDPPRGNAERIPGRYGPRGTWIEGSWR
jgi:hypothetical protein